MDRAAWRAHEDLPDAPHPVGTRLQAELEMRHHDPDGKEFTPDKHVFGNEVGEPVGSIDKGWRLACVRAGVRDLNFHDLRREFASRLLESGAPEHDVRDFLGHANITTTSRYLQSSALRLGEGPRTPRTCGKSDKRRPKRRSDRRTDRAALVD